MTTSAEMAANTRAFVERHGGAWPADVRDWWLVLAEAWDAQPEMHRAGCECPVHIVLPISEAEASAIKLRFVVELRQARTAALEPVQEAAE